MINFKDFNFKNFGNTGLNQYFMFSINSVIIKLNFKYFYYEK